MNGLHLIADLYQCACNRTLLLDCNTLEQACVQYCQQSGLTPLGAYFYQFLQEDGEPAGVTGTVVLAESHVAIHTWPETGSVTLDIYVCNFSRDNSDRARAVYDAIVHRLAPDHVAAKEVIRGELPVSQAIALTTDKP